MDGEKLAKCFNCDRDIAESKLDLHEAYCRRNVIRCPKCKEPVDKNEMETHEEENHKKKKCNDCGIELSISAFESHPKVCSKKPKECKFCSLTINANEYSDHIYQCASRTKVCPNCKKNIILRDFDHHEISCVFESSNTNTKNFPNLQDTSSNKYQQPSTNLPSRSIPKPTVEPYQAIEQKNRYEPLADRKPIVEKNVQPATNYSNPNSYQGTSYTGSSGYSALNNPTGIPSANIDPVNKYGGIGAQGVSKYQPSNATHEIPSRVPVSKTDYSKPSQPVNKPSGGYVKQPSMETNKQPGIDSYKHITTDSTKGPSIGGVSGYSGGGHSGGGYSGSGYSGTGQQPSNYANIKSTTDPSRPGSNTGGSNRGSIGNNRIPVSTGISVTGNSNPRAPVVNKDSGSSSNTGGGGAYKPGNYQPPASHSNGTKIPGRTTEPLGPNNSANTKPTHPSYGLEQDKYKKTSISGASGKLDRKEQERLDYQIAQKEQEKRQQNPVISSKPQNKLPDYDPVHPDEDEEIQRAIQESMGGNKAYGGSNFAPGGYDYYNPNLNDTMNDEDIKKAIALSKQYK